jgi:hypothetical protein
MPEIHGGSSSRCATKKDSIVNTKNSFQAGAMRQNFLRFQSCGGKRGSIGKVNQLFHLARTTPLPAESICRACFAGQQNLSLEDIVQHWPTYRILQQAQH